MSCFYFYHTARLSHVLLLTRPQWAFLPSQTENHTLKRCLETPIQCNTIIQLIIAAIPPPHYLYVPKMQFVMVTERSQLETHQQETTTPHSPYIVISPLDGAVAVRSAYNSSVMLFSVCGSLLFIFAHWTQDMSTHQIDSNDGHCTVYPLPAQPSSVQ